MCDCARAFAVLCSAGKFHQSSMIIYVHLMANSCTINSLHINYLTEQKQCVFQERSIPLDLRSRNHKRSQIGN